jgi:hypothetical protein
MQHKPYWDILDFDRNYLRRQEKYNTKKMEVAAGVKPTKRK